MSFLERAFDLRRDEDAIHAGGVPALLVLSAVISLSGIGVAAESAPPQAATEEHVAFRSGDITLHGTVLIPEADGAVPAFVLLHGAGLGRRDENRLVAEAFARQGFVTLIYDKRTAGYSANPVGDRSYALLANDAVAAVEMLQRRDDVDPAWVGLWGFSEGGWVAPLAATRSAEVAFVITVAAGGVGPAEQSAWATEGALRRRGVSSDGSLRALTERTYRFLVSAGLFAEGTYDPVSVLERLDQPVLAIWGALDHTMPPAASAQAMQQALESAENPHYVLRLIPDASHAVRAVVGDQVTDAFAPGYIETMVAWTRDVVAGDPPGPSVDALPSDERPTRPMVTDTQGMARWEVQLAFIVTLSLAFGGYLVTGLFRRWGRAGPEPLPGRWRARLVAVLGLIVCWGVYAYTGFIAATSGEEVAIVVAGRPIGWFVLQLLTVVLLLCAASVAVARYRQPRRIEGFERMRFALLMGGTVLFVPWAVWWQLFSL